MKFRHLGAFPFAQLGAAVNPAEVEPISLTLAEAVSLWWKAKRMLFTFSVDVSDGTSPGAPNYNTVDNSSFADAVKPLRSGITDGQELLLCFPGADRPTSTSEDGCAFTFNTSSLSPPFGVRMDLSCSFKIFLPDGHTESYSATTVLARGFWQSLTVKPTIIASLTLRIVNALENGAEYLATNLTPTDNDGSFTGSIFGQSVTFKYSLTDGPFGPFQIQNPSLAITRDTDFLYA